MCIVDVSNDLSFEDNYDADADTGTGPSVSKFDGVIDSSSS